jgi:hypothetical protein
MKQKAQYEDLGSAREYVRQVRNNGWPPGLSVPEIQGLHRHEHRYALALRHELMNATEVGGFAGIVFAEREWFYDEVGGVIEKCDKSTWFPQSGRGLDKHGRRRKA